MIFTETTFIGMDPTAGERPFVYAALDHELRLVALGQGSIDDVLAFAAGQEKALAAVCAPQKPNQGVMRRPEVREGLSSPPQPGRWMDSRLADYLLRQHNIRTPQVPSREGDCPNWMRMGFTLFRRLEGLGYQRYPKDGAARQCLEVYPHACFTVLLAVLPFQKNSMEGRLQRQLVLHERRVSVYDPMRIFEEFTRFRLLSGVLPLEDLHTPGELDALIAAYTAWLAAKQPGGVTLLGDPEEGQVTLPIAGLKGRYG